MPIRPAQTVLLAVVLMLGACGTRGPLTLTPRQQAEYRAYLEARQKALQQAQPQEQTQETQNQDASTAVDTTTTKEPLR